MSTKRTKADKLQQQTEELDKRLDDVPDENARDKSDREEPSRADIDAVKH